MFNVLLFAMFYSTCPHCDALICMTTAFIVSFPLGLVVTSYSC